MSSTGVRSSPSPERGVSRTAPWPGRIPDAPDSNRPRFPFALVRAPAEAVRLMTATARQAGLQARGHRYSRTAAVALGLVAVDGVGLLQRERDLVEAFEQAPARLGLEFERHGAAVEAHFERLEVDLAIAGRHQRAHLILGQHDREQADLRAV